jgi:alpha-tubulin suppressor-like RCC1 family protein
VVGSEHTLALSDDGKVYGWGNNSHGQLGLNQKVHGVFVQQPTVVQELTPDKCILQVMNLKSAFAVFSAEVSLIILV